MIEECCELKNFLEGRIDVANPIEMMHLLQMLPQHFVTCSSCFKVAYDRVLIGLPYHWISSGEGVQLSTN